MWNDAFLENSSHISDSLVVFRTIAVNHLFALAEVEITAEKSAATIGRLNNWEDESDTPSAPNAGDITLVVMRI